MPTTDPAQIIKDALVASWEPLHSDWAATLHVDDDWRPEPSPGKQALVLVADDGGPPVHPGPWLLRKSVTRPLIRMTSFTTGRHAAREVVESAADWVLANRPDGIARIDGVSLPVITRDPDTGNFLGTLTMPVLVRPV